MSDKSSSKPAENPVTAFLSSVRLSIFLLLALAATSIIGTLIPQEMAPAEYLHGLGPAAYKLFKFFDLFDMYRSWWFQLLLGLLGLNLLVCTLKRFPMTWKIVAKTKPAFREARFKAVRAREEFTTPEAPAEAAARVEAFLKKKFRVVIQDSGEEATRVYAEKGRWTRLGFYIVHAAFACTLVGGMAGSLWGWTGYVRIPEGEAIQAVTARKTQKEIPLDFTLRCDDFSVDYYEDGRTPKEYTSFVTVTEPGIEPWRTDIRVNHPLRLRGLSFFQSSFHVSSHSGTVDVSFSNPETGEGGVLTLPIARMAPLPGGSGRVMIAGYRENYQVHGQDLGPAVQLHLFPNEGRPLSMVLPVGLPDFALQRGGWSISVEGASLEPSYITVLQVTKDPGVAVVYTGFILIILGCIITFFLSHQQLYVRISPAPGGALVEMAGAANKNRQGFEEQVRRLARTLAHKE